MKQPKAPKGFHYTPEGMMSDENPIYKRSTPLKSENLKIKSKKDLQEVLKKLPKSQKGTSGQGGLSNTSAYRRGN